MEVNEQLIDELAALSRLEFSPTEKTAIAEDLRRMIRFVEKLQELDTTGVEPVLDMSDTSNSYREDIVQGQVSREAALQNAPSAESGFFTVPKVITK